MNDVPCLSPDDHCRLKDKCSARRDFDRGRGKGDPAWLENKCVELLSRAEGWTDVDGEVCDD